jgi:hypothetical protein
MPKDRRDPGVQRQVEPDSETERQDADGHEPRRPAKTADAVSKILGESLDPAEHSLMKRSHREFLFVSNPPGDAQFYAIWFTSNAAASDTRVAFNPT